MDRYRPWLSSPGEPPLTVLGPVECAMRLAAFVSWSGLDPNDVALAPTCPTPAPVYVRDPGSRRRFAGAKPEALWHPLFWLPERLSSRYLIEEDGQAAPETDEAWLARVMIESAAAGLYDEHSGEWLDVLARAGLDVDDPAHRDRVSAWLAGADDPALDGIDQDALYPVSPSDPTWAVIAAAMTVEALRPTSWWVHADELLADLDAAVIDADNLTDDELRAIVRIVVSIGHESFSAMPPPPPDFPDPAHADRATLVGEIIPTIQTLLDGIRRSFTLPDDQPDTFDDVALSWT